MTLPTASIATTATKTAVGFTLLGLVTTIIMLGVNALMVASTLKNFPIPEIKSVTVKGLEEGPARVFLDIEFPGSANGNLISAQTEGPIEVSAFISGAGERLPKDPSLSVKLPSGFNLNLASKRPTPLVVDDLEIDFGAGFNAAIFSKLIEGIILNDKEERFNAESLPNVMIQVKTRVVVKSLWIPLGASLNWPFKINLADILKKQKKNNNKDNAKYKNTPPISTLKEEEKNQILKEFDFMPRNLKVSAADNEKFEIVAIAALPAILIPEFLTVEVPKISLQAGFYDLKVKINEVKAEKFIQVSVEPFLLHSSAKEIQVKVTLLMDKLAASNAQKFLELARDRKHDIGIQMKQDDSFISTKKAGGLMFWLKDFILNVPVGSLLADYEKKSKENKQSETESEFPIADEQSLHLVDTKIVKSKNKEISVKVFKSAKPKRLVAVKFLKAVRAANGNGGTFFVTVNVKRSVAKFLIGKLPELAFQAKMADNHLLGIKVSSEEIKPTTKQIKIILEFSFSNLKQMIFFGLRAGSLDSPAMRQAIPELKDIREIDFVATSDNIISRLASVFNLKILLGKEGGGVKSVRFSQGSATEIYSSTTANSKKKSEIVVLKKSTSRKTTPKSSTSKHIKAKFAIENVDTNVSIGASLKIPKSILFNDYIHISWSKFDLALKHNSKYLFDFKIDSGFFDLGTLGDSLSGSLGAGILIPAAFDELENLSQFLKDFMEEEGKKLLPLDFEIKYGEETIKLDALIPCKALLAEKNKESNEHEAPKEHETPKESSPPRTDFLSKVKNSVVSFVSIQAPTIFFHLTYPNKNYCTETGGKFDTKIDLQVKLPMIEANVCAKEGVRGVLKCFVGAGLSRPMRLKASIIDGQICQVSSRIMPAEAPLAGAKALKRSTNIKFASNEIPIHVSVKDLEALVRFVEMAGAKRKQFIVIGPVNDATNVNKFIGVVISSLLSIEFPPPVAKIEKVVVSSDSTKHTSEPLNVNFMPDSPAILEVGTSSISNNQLEVLLGFRLPPMAHEGIATVLSPEMMFNWPVLQWGGFDFILGIDESFEAKISLKRGQIDLKEEGIVMSALNDFALRFSLTTHKNIKLGSTALRQIFGTLKNYFETPKDQRRSFDKKFISNCETSKLYYKFRMKGPRGLNDPGKFFAEGDTLLKDILALTDAIINRPALPEAEEESETIPALEAPKPEEESLENPFEHVRISMLTVSDPEGSPQTKLPCLIPALCSSTALELSTTAANDMEKSSHIGLVFQLKNVLRPIIGIVGGKLGPVLEKFKMTQYPSHLEMRYTGLTDVWLTFLLNGAGIVSLGLEPIEFSRDALIKYSSPTTMLIPQDIRTASVHHIFDSLEVALKIRFPPTIKGIRSALNVLRRESLLMPAIPPVYYSISETGNLVQRTLTNAPFNLALSSDDPYNLDGNNLVSALIAAAMPEILAPGLNPTDAMLKSFYDETKKEATENVPPASAPSSKTPEDSEKAVLERGAIDMGQAFGIVTCILTGFKCDSQFDMSVNLKLPFGVKILRFILPATSIFRVFVDEKPVLQFVADARKQKKLNISPLKGVDVLGSASVCLEGIDKGRFGKTKKAISYLSGKSGSPAPIKLQVIFGSDINLSAELDFPFYKVRALAVNKFKSWIPDISGLVSNAWSFFSSKPVEEELTGIIKPSQGSLISIPAAEINLIRPERRQCLTNDISNAERNKRLQEIEYENTAIFFELGHAGVLPNKNTKVFIQLRTKEEEIVCGQPTETSSFTLILSLIKKDQGFVSLRNVFSYEAPLKDESFHFQATFNHALNLFETDINLLHTGRYEASIKFGRKTVHLPNTILYAKHAY